MERHRQTVEGHPFQARAILAILLLLSAPAAAAGLSVPLPHSSGPVLVARGQSCKTVGSCREAVESWCDGYSRADADHDGIPCENICHSRQQVEAIEQQIGCDL